ncbi:hypothetical protein DD237_008271 [Peronospora effusa]|uniref:Uncharacterized protein n=1 Tax=Peronospora effusa TaxID=542832 RepID=A0A425C2M0_9STRA|nr:hypothetical protein DD237_008271 [Peronospora effusa]
MRRQLQALQSKLRHQTDATILCAQAVLDQADAQASPTAYVTVFLGVADLIKTQPSTFTSEISRRLTCISFVCLILYSEESALNIFELHRYYIAQPRRHLGEPIKELSCSCRPTFIYGYLQPKKVAGHDQRKFLNLRPGNAKRTSLGTTLRM